MASKYPGDVGLASDPAVLYFLDFDDQQAMRIWFKDKVGYGWTGDAGNVLAGNGALEIQKRNLTGRWMLPSRAMKGRERLEAARSFHKAHCFQSR